LFLLGLSELLTPGGGQAEQLSRLGRIRVPPQQGWEDGALDARVLIWGCRGPAAAVWVVKSDFGIN